MRVASGVLCLGLVLAACSGETAPEGAGEPVEQPTTATAGPTTGATAGRTGTPSVAQEPLVLAVGATRPVEYVPVRAARRLLRTGVSTWAALGQTGEDLRLLTGGLPEADAVPGAELTDAATALRDVRRDPDALALVPASAVDPTVRVLTVGGVSPLRTPDRYPFQVATGIEPGTVVTTTIAGDVMLGRRVGDELERLGDPAAALRPMARRLAAADITVANLESTLSSDGIPTQGGDSFAADPAALEGLRLAGVDALSLANNHVGDFGEQALLKTLDRLDGAGFGRFGAGRDLSDARRPVVLEVDGVRTGFLGTDSIGESPAATPSSPGTNRLDMPPRTGPLDRVALQRVASDVRRLDRRVDTVVVMPHWGTQYTYVPEPIQRHVARVLARAGADLVVGGHPHWVQGWQMVDDTLVVHSLGNFVFDMDFSRETQEGVLLEVVTWDGRVMAADPVPYVIGADFAPRVAPAVRGSAIVDSVWSTSRGPFRLR